MANITRRAPRRVLVRGVNWLGDAVMTTPALQRLRERFPGATITLLTPEKLRDLWTAHPAVDELITFRPQDGVLTIAARLRREAFHLALVLPNSPRSALEPWLARIPWRVGYARSWRKFFLTDPLPARPKAVAMRKRTPREIRALIDPDALRRHRVPIPFNAHQVHEYLHLVDQLGGSPKLLAPELVVLPPELVAVRQKFALPEHAGPLVGLNPGAEYGPAKRWPVDRFIAAALAVQARYPVNWVLFGGPNDVATAGQIETALRAAKAAVFNLAGRTTLRELMAALKLCRVLLTNDTGPMHVAAALGTPVVVPFGSTAPELTGPGLPADPRHRLIRSNVPCAPCFLRECPIDLRCLHGIPVGQVAEYVLELLA